MVSLGNYYGFVRRRGNAANRPVDLESSIYFLQRAIDLKPQAGESMELTVGYAEFCMGMVKGMLGDELTNPANPDVANLQEKELRKLQQEGQDLMTEAVELLQQAATKGQHLPGQYHLRAYLLFSLGSIDEAAKVWGQGAKQARPPSSTLYFNQACALAKLGKYSESLTALESAVEIVARRGIGLSGFDPRLVARDANNQEGAELSPFRTGQGEAAKALSAKGKSFDQIIT
jgi:tetratricopeptide (TPR) repeat protein